MTAIVPAQLILQRCAENRLYRDSVQTPAFLEELELRAKAIRARGDLGVVRPVPLPFSADDVDTWLQAIPQAGAEERDHALKVEAINSLITKCDSMIQSHAANRDKNIANLQRALPAIQDGLGDAVRRLNGAHSPQAVIATGVGDVWNEIAHTHCAAVEDFYTAFDWFVAGEPTYTIARSEYLIEDDWASEARIRNIAKIFPAWRQPAPDVTVARWNRPDPRPWPTDRVGRIVWLHLHAELWAPTPSQLRELRTQRIAEHAHPNGEPKTAGPQLNHFDRVVPELASTERTPAL